MPMKSTSFTEMTRYDLIQGFELTSLQFHFKIDFVFFVRKMNRTAAERFRWTQRFKCTPNRGYSKEPAKMATINQMTRCRDLCVRQRHPPIRMPSSMGTVRCRSPNSSTSSSRHPSTIRRDASAKRRMRPANDSINR